MCLSVSEQNSSQTDAPIWTRFLLNGCKFEPVHYKQQFREDCVKISVVVGSAFCSQRTDRHTDRQTNKNIVGSVIVTVSAH